MASIVLEDIHVSYPVRVSGRERSTMAALANTASFGRIATDLSRVPMVQAVRGVSLTIADGERVAVIGSNGAGKSTLLKAIAGILAPTSGRVSVTGSKLALLSLGGGLNVEKSARQNLRMMARFLSIDRSEIDAFVSDVEAFTELNEFFDLPLSTYSDGMLVRFMFGAMTFRTADVLVVDEIIGAGDASFLKKAEARAKSMFKASNILVMSSHAPQVTYELCDRAIWMEKGKIVADGSPSEVWGAYQEAVNAGHK